MRLFSLGAPDIKKTFGQKTTSGIPVFCEGYLLRDPYRGPTPSRADWGPSDAWTQAFNAFVDMNAEAIQAKSTKLKELLDQKDRACPVPVRFSSQ